MVPGSAAHIDTGERVSLANPGTVPAPLLVVISPPEFAARPGGVAGRPTRATAPAAERSGIPPWR